MILVFCLVLACSAQLSCTKITCGSNTAPTCYSYTAATDSAVSSKCSSGYYCPFNYANTIISYQCEAEPTPVVTYNAVPGQSCNSTNMCVTGTTCTNGYCVGLSLNAQCSLTVQCNPGLYCRFVTPTSNTCQNLVASGATCGSLDTCTYGNECHLGKCTPMFSIASGAAVEYALCNSQGYSAMCRYGECYDVNTTYSICINAIKNLDSYDTECTTCEGEADTAGNSYSRVAYCQCGLGGKSYCPGFGGDTYGSKSFELARKYYLSSDVSKCNIHAGLSCMSDHWDSEDYYEYVYYSWLASERWRYIGADSCLYEHLDQQYTYIKNKYDDYSSSSSGAEMLAISALILSLVA